MYKKIFIFGIFFNYLSLAAFANYVKEPVPLNRFSQAEIKKDKIISTPPFESIQTFGGVEYGINKLTQENLREFVKPGDIAIHYDPLNLYSDPVHIAKQGMLHASLVVEEDGKLCHLDSPDSLSGCNWTSNYHFIRVNDQNAAEVLRLAKILSTAKNYIYETEYFTDGLVTPLKQLKESIERKEEQKFYCSEIPFTLHSIVKDKPIFGGELFSSVVEDYKKITSKQRFLLNTDKDSTKRSLESEFQRGIQGEELQLVGTALDQYLSDGFFANEMKKMLDEKKGKSIPPHLFLKEAKKKDSDLHYIGSLEASKNLVLWKENVTSDPTEDIKLVLSTDGNKLLVFTKTWLKVFDTGSGKVAQEFVIPEKGFSIADARFSKNSILFVVEHGYMMMQERGQESLVGVSIDAVALFEWGPKDKEPVTKFYNEFNIKSPSFYFTEIKDDEHFSMFNPFSARFIAVLDSHPLSRCIYAEKRMTVTNRTDDVSDMGTFCLQEDKLVPISNSTFDSVSPDGRYVANYSDNGPGLGHGEKDQLQIIKKNGEKVLFEYKKVKAHEHLVPLGFLELNKFYFVYSSESIENYDHIYFVDLTKETPVKEMTKYKIPSSISGSIYSQVSHQLFHNFQMQLAWNTSVVDIAEKKTIAKFDDLGISEVAISRDGRRIFALTKTGDLVAVDWSVGMLAEAVPNY